MLNACRTSRHELPNPMSPVSEKSDGSTVPTLGTPASAGSSAVYQNQQLAILQHADGKERIVLTYQEVAFGLCPTTNQLGSEFTSDLNTDRRRGACCGCTQSTMLGSKGRCSRGEGTKTFLRDIPKEDACCEE